MNIKEINKLLTEYELNAKKSFGQNFLIDDNVLKKIATSLKERRYEGVVEIGPGLGSLTRYLVNEYSQVLCYEIDSDMIRVLNETIKVDNLKVIEKDFLTTSPERDIKDYFTGSVCLIANLPYYITTPILLKLLEEVPSIKDMVIMVQKEVAERFIAKPKTKDYNALSVLIQYFTNVNKLFDVSPASFVPQPKVSSSVVSILYKEKTDLNKAELTFFLKFNRNIFRQRRKTLVNNLASSYNIDKENLGLFLEKNGFSRNVRSEELSVIEIVELSKKFSSLVR